MSKMILGLIGSNVSRSFSPVIHQAFFQASGINGEYRLLSVSESELASTLSQLTCAPLFTRGINVTIPYKAVMLDFVDHVESAAQTAGAINTVVFSYDQSTISKRSGYNTDIAGLKASLEGSLDVASVIGARAAVLGLGGAARASVIALFQMGVRDIVLIGRTLERGRSFIDSMKFEGVDFTLYSTEDELPEDQAENFRAIKETLSTCSIFIHATSIGHNDDQCPQWLPGLISALPQNALVQDLVYAKSDDGTIVCKLADERGLMCADGKAMLVHQARHAFELWTGFLPPYEDGMQALEKAIKAI